MWGNPIWRSILIQIMHLLLTRFVCSFHTSSNTLRRPRKFEKISQHYLQFSLLFSNVKKRLFPTFVAFSECQNFTNVHIWVFYEYLMKTQEQELFFKNDFTPYMLLCIWRFFPTYHLTKHKKNRSGLGWNLLSHRTMVYSTYVPSNGWIVITVENIWMIFGWSILHSFLLRVLYNSLLNCRANGKRWKYELH